jgi:hypothetical protein
MATVNIAYAASAAITITITSLTSTSQRQSTAVDNTSNLYLDALVAFKIKTASAGTSATGAVKCYVYGTADGGTDYGDTVTGSDGSVTLTSPPNLRLLTVLNAVANSTTYISDPVSVAAAYGGVLPAKWGIVIENDTAATLDGTVGSAWYTGVTQTVS